jgi:hypothetical protein
MQFWVVLEKRVLGETGRCLFFCAHAFPAVRFLYRQKSISGYGVKPHLLLFFILIFSLGLKSKAETLAVPTGLPVDVVWIDSKVWIGF